MLYPNELRVLKAASELAESLGGDPNHTVAAAAMDTTGMTARRRPGQPHPARSRSA